ncbi:MAG TPA: hypothetical protein VGS97_05610 [Actinocrinis sp.]|uniref:hypothetical protein n=1 Tax=Actinocrinis sp. TaxID=1920516 RepID=UPI002DDD05D1|nr:hypothetical protein [Actinocrinis sp.]HEV2343552.1 hypothetical protein [Actinocrinis sp.]
MGLEIEIEYDDTPDGVWAPASEPPLPSHSRLSRPRLTGPPVGHALSVHFGIALTTLVLGAASTAGLLTGRTAAHDRTTVLLHLAPVAAFVVQALPAPPATQNAADLLATPWTNTFDQDMTLSVINDGPDPVTVLGATISAMDFQPAALTPASTAPTAPGDVSLLRGRAHFVCGDYPQPDASATIANLSTRTADGQAHRETLMVDRFSEIAEQAVCARMPGPQIVRAVTVTPSRTPGTYTVTVTATDRAAFPLRMALLQAAVENWESGGGLQVATRDDVLIPPHGTGSIAISVSVDDCAAAGGAASGAFLYDTLGFSDGRDAAGYPQARLIQQTVAIADPNAIMTYCLAKSAKSDGL